MSPAIGAGPPKRTIKGLPSLVVTPHHPDMRQRYQGFASIAPSAAPLRSAADAARFFGWAMGRLDREILRIAYLDRTGRVIAVSDQPGGDDALPLSIARIVREACCHGSKRLLIAHNHPSGNPHPSRADRHATRRLAELLRAIDIELVDHLVFARGGVSSFRALGLL